MGKLSLKFSEDHYKELLEQASDLIQSVDSNGKFVYVNRAWKEKLGYTAEEVASLSLWDIIHPQSLAHCQEVFQNVINEEKIDLVEAVFITKKGEPLYVEGNANCRFDDVNKISSTLGIFRDVTESREKEKALRQSEEKYRALVENLNEVVYVLDENARVQYISPNITSLAGYSLDEISKMSFIDFVHPDDKGERMTAFGRALAGKNEMTEYRFFTKDARIAWVSTKAKPIIKNGRPAGVQGVLTDISDRKETEKRLAESEKNFRTFFETMDDLIFVADQEGKIYFSNSAVRKKLGYSRSELNKMHILDLYPKDKQKELKQIFEDMLATKKDSCPLPLSTKYGNCLLAETRIWSGEWDGRKCIFGIAKDISKEQEALQKFNRIFENNPAPMALNLLPEIIFTEVNTAFQETLGYSKDEIIGKASRELDCFLQREKWHTLVDKLKKNRHVRNLELKMKAKNGQILDGLFSGELIESQGKEYFLTVMNNITERKKMEELLAMEKEQFKTTLLSVGDGVISTDNQSNIRVMNQIAEKLTGWSQEEALGQPLEKVFRIIHEFTRKRCENPAEKVLQNGDIIKMSNHSLLISKTGREIPIEDSAAPIKDHDGQITGVVIVFRDFTEKREKQTQIEYLSFHDHLTGLYNRRYIEDAIKRLDTDRNLPFTIMDLDVNGLKLANDAFGHIMGDQLLKTVGEIIKKVCRADDIIGRMGGDEFVILLPRTDEKQAYRIKQKIISMAAKTKLEPVIVSLAVGYAVKTSSYEDIENTKKNADKYMYKNKLKYGKAMGNQTIETVIRNLNTKYDKEQNHTERVSQYCELIARAMELSEKEIHDIKTAAVLHDIGKIMVPPELLSKPGKLTEEEFELIKRHTETGYQILRSVDDYVSLAEQILYHHEHWDGKGYPEGLIKADIPLGARIIAVADAYEAMTAKRPYQKTKTQKEAIAELKKYAGIQFDPDVVEVFVFKVL